ncbi:SusE domain-containing protein [Flavobacterium aestivum]|uniref:SusE domain-containing protein n=1 Tax=Flavobacterium aestivum TaxID=3003257 RepID=UPI0022859D23|nr:SusE domain-containing protein [Flavobacterium aestivum]
MKNLNKILIAFISVIAISCSGDDVENRPVIVKGTEPVLLSPKSDFNIILSKENENDLATTVVWEPATYVGDATVITYTIEIAKKGTNFATPFAAATSTSTYKNLTVAELNSALINAGFPAKVESEIDIRVKSTIGGVGSTPQISNSYTIKATPYHVPLATSHWLVGDATPGGWTWAGDAETEFPLIIGRTDAYKVAVVLNSGKAFRVFLGNNFTADGNWDASHNYTYYASNGFVIPADLVDALDGDHNFKYTGPTKERVLTIDYASKKITLE